MMSERQILLARIKKLEVALTPFAAEADQWADRVSNDFHPGMSEPGKRYVHRGAKAVFSIGNCRRAKKLLAGEIL